MTFMDYPSSVTINLFPLIEIFKILDLFLFLAAMKF